MTMAKWILYRNRRYIRVATDLYGTQWFATNEIGALMRMLQKWGAADSPKVGRVFWHDEKRKYLLVPGIPSENEVAEYLAKDDPEKFEKEQRYLRPVSYSEIEDKCRRCMGIDWQLVKNVFKELEDRKRED
jgi:hypothetical protein